MNKTGLLTILGTIGAFTAKMLGGWDDSLTTLLIFMGIDFVLGLIVAAVFHKSNKSENGALDSRASLKGLIKKGMILLIVLVAAQLDIMIGSNFIRDGVVIAFIANETISIIENAGIMGVPIPAVITNAIDILQRKSEKDVDKDDVNA
jgi:toxin secretion/phage lysis holin